MKKLLVALLCAVSTLAVAAPTEVEVVWGFSPAATPLNYLRHTIAKANESQQKYQFNLVLKPGASGKISTNYTQAHSAEGKLVLMYTTNIFFLRTFVYDNSEYTTDEFKLFLPLASQPHALATSSSRTLEQVLSKKAPTVGVVQLSGSTHMMAERMRRSRPDIVVVPYNSPPEVQQAVGNGSVDMGFPALSSALTDTRVTAQGVIGSRAIKGVLPMHKRGFPGLEKYDINFFIVAHKSMPDAVSKELYTILKQATANNKAYDETLAVDIASPINIKPSQYSAWYKEQVDIARDASLDVKEK